MSEEKAGAEKRINAPMIPDPMCQRCGHAWSTHVVEEDNSYCVGNAIAFTGDVTGGVAVVYPTPCPCKTFQGDKGA